MVKKFSFQSEFFPLRADSFYKDYFTQGSKQKSLKPFPMKYWEKKGASTPMYSSGGGVVDNTPDYQSRDRKIDPPLLQSFIWDFKPRSRLRMTSLLVGR